MKTSDLNEHEASKPNVIKRFVNFVILRIQGSKWWKSSWRRTMLRMTGIKIGRSFVGQDVIFDSVHPENIEIGDSCTITMRSVILTHFVHSKRGSHWYTDGKVKIGNNVVIGAHVIICQPVTIGDDVVIAAGAVVTKDIPSGEIWGGVPAKFIRKVEGYE